MPPGIDGRGRMVLPDLVYVVGVSTVLSTVSVGVARFELGVSSGVCLTALFPLLVVSSTVAMLARIVFAIHPMLLVGVVGVFLLALAGVGSLARR